MGKPGRGDWHCIVSLFCVRFPHSLRSRLPSRWLTVIGCGRGAIYGRACPSRKMVKRKERKMAEQYVEQLAAARERIVADRRELADELAKPYERGRYEQWRRIIEVQATIDAIDRAITDERSIKDKGKPVSLVDLG